MLGAGSGQPRRLQPNRREPTCARTGSGTCGTPHRCGNRPCPPGPGSGSGPADLDAGPSPTGEAWVLLTRDWMRAMSLKDPDVPRAVRPDHSYTGSYDGWIPLTVAAMWRLGAQKDAYDFYCRTAEVTKEGPFAQAHEFYGPNPTSNDAPVRIALRGANMKECISGVAFTDVVINTFFGFSPSVDGKILLTDEVTPRPFSGTLQNVRYGKSLYEISADKNGLSLKPVQH